MIVFFFYSLTDKKQYNLQTLYITDVKFLSNINSSFIQAIVHSTRPYYVGEQCLFDSNSAICFERKFPFRSAIDPSQNTIRCVSHAIVCFRTDCWFFDGVWTKQFLIEKLFLCIWFNFVESVFARFESVFSAL